MELNKLNEPFEPKDIEWRVQSCGEKGGIVWAMVLAYVTNRAIMNRLDAVVGKANWKNEYVQGPGGGVLCGLSIKIDNEWITKWDGADNTDMEAVKGGLSGSMKRAAVQWGIGRYLYKLEATWGEVHDNGRLRGKTKDNKYFKWDPPALPSWALPKEYVSDLETDTVTQYLGSKNQQLDALQKTKMVDKGAKPIHFTKTKAYLDKKAEITSMIEVNKNQLDDASVGFAGHIDTYVTSKVESGSSWQAEMKIIFDALQQKVEKILKEIY